MNKFWVVALETYKRNVKSASFIIMIIAPFLFVGLMGVVSYFSSGIGDESEIAVISDSPEIKEAFLSQIDLDVDKKIKTEAEAKKALENEELDGYLVIENDVAAASVSGHYVGTESLGTMTETEMQQALSGIQLGQTAALFDLKNEDVQRLSQPAAFKSEVVEFKDGEMTEKGMNRMALTLAAFFIGFAMYMIILMYAQITSVEVASEKGTRIMEIILSSTSAAKHFYGKVMGIFLVILTQVLVYLLLGVGAFFFVQDMPQVKDFLEIVSLKDLIAGILGYNLVFLLFGVMIYTILAAFCGSLVSKAEDAGKAAAPVTYLTIFGFLINSMFGMSNPQHILIKVTSYVPFLSTFTMPSRIASGTVTDLGVLVSLGILIVSTFVVLVLSARMYKATALVYSDDGITKSLKKSFILMKSQK